MHRSSEPNYPELRVLLLGPVRLLDKNSNEISLSPRETVVLAALATRIGSAIPVAELSKMIWGEFRPESAVNSIQVSVHSIRQKLKNTAIGQVIITRRGGYELDPTIATTDLDVMNAYLHVADMAHEKKRLIAEAEALRRGLDQWRGLPLSDLPTEIMRDFRLKSIDRYLEILIRWTDCMFELERGNSTIATLREATICFPWAEGLQARLMAAMHNSGRTVDALNLYSTLRKTLVENFGTEPSKLVQEVHRKILNEEPLISVKCLTERQV